MLRSDLRKHIDVREAYRRARIALGMDRQPIERKELSAPPDAARQKP
ncbi:MAG: hypothetical protein WB795_24880 [Candidatus Acidiferrales bacterium]